MKREMVVFSAGDGGKVTGTVYSALAIDTCLILAPGFAAHRGTKNFVVIAERLAATLDVVCIDFRGNGGSDGRYTFGEREYLDLKPVYEWAKSKYAKVSLMGFSLGAYSALRATVEFEFQLEQLLLVSCPTKVDEIFWSTAIAKHLLLQVRGLRFLKKDRQVFFRWGFPLGEKPSAVEFAPRLKVPVSFLVADRDSLVTAKMSRQVFEAAPEPKKWFMISNDDHADELMILEPQITFDWVLNALRP